MEGMGAQRGQGGGQRPGRASMYRWLMVGSWAGSASFASGPRDLRSGVLPRSRPMAAKRGRAVKMGAENLDQPWGGGALGAPKDSMSALSRTTDRFPEFFLQSRATGVPGSESPPLDPQFSTRHPPPRTQQSRPVEGDRSRATAARAVTAKSQAL